MPKKPAEPEVQENTAPKIDPQKQYLMDQFGNLMERLVMDLVVHFRKN